MPLGPFDAITNHSSLDHLAIGSSVSSRANERSSDFAEHLQSPAKPKEPPREERRTDKSSSEKSDSPSESKPEPKAATTTPAGSEKPTQDKPTAASQPTDDSAQPDSSCEDASTPAVAQAVADENSEDKQDDDARDIDALEASTGVANVTQPVVKVETPTNKSEQPSAGAGQGEQAKPNDGLVANANEPPPAVAQAEAATPAKQADEKSVRPQIATAATKDAVEAPQAAAEATTVREEVVDTNVVAASQEVAETVSTPAPTKPRQDAKIGKTEHADKEGESAEVASAIDATAEKADPTVAKTRDGKRERTKADAKGNRSDSDTQVDPTNPRGAEPASPGANVATPTTSTAIAAEIASVVDGSTKAAPTPTSSSATSPTVENPAAASKLPESFLTRSTSRGATGTSGAPVTTAEQARLIQRVAKAFQSAQNRGGELRLRLSPPELGALRLEIKLQSGVMTARLEAETPAAKAVLLENLPALKDRLAEQGIQVEKFDVDLMDRQSTGQQDSPQEQRQPSSQRGVSRPLSGGRTSLSEVTTTTSSERPNRNDGRLNVTV